MGTDLGIESVATFIKVLKMLEESTTNNELLKSPLIGKRVIARSRNAGVMYGTLVSVKGQHVVLKDARLLWRWRTANLGNTLNDAASEGLTQEYTKLSKSNPIVEMLEACSLIEVSDKASGIIDSIKEYVNEDA